ncbi:hypothetical protein Bca4012_025368 [Brassica carinata]
MKEMNQKMGTHKFRFSDIMPHSWLISSKESAKVTENAFLLPNTSPPLMLLPQESSVTLFVFLHLLITLKALLHLPNILSRRNSNPSSRLNLSSSSLTSHVPLTTYRNHRSKSSSSNAIILDPPLNSNVSLTSSLNHRSKSSSVHAISDSTVESSSLPVSSSSYDQTYGIKAFVGDVSEDPSISDNSRPVLVETVKQPPFDTRKQQKLKKPKAGSSGTKIRIKLKIARKKTKGRTSQESKKNKIAESFAVVLTSVDPESDFRESMVEMIVENKMKERQTWKIFSCVIFR